MKFLMFSSNCNPTERPVEFLSLLFHHVVMRQKGDKSRHGNPCLLSCTPSVTQYKQKSLLVGL